VAVRVECIPLPKNPRSRWINLCLSYGDSRISATFTEINSRLLESRRRRELVGRKRVIRSAASDDEMTKKKKKKEKEKKKKKK
jgi:hypothetical protein